jgi:hypothetical protein
VAIRYTVANTTDVTANTVVMRNIGFVASVPASTPCRLVSMKVA